jgi:hypothetical protein
VFCVWWRKENYTLSLRRKIIFHSRKLHLTTQKKPLRNSLKP